MNSNDTNKNGLPAKLSVAAKVILGLPKTIMLIVYLGIAYFAWMCFGPEKFEPSPSREKATERIVSQMMLKIRENRGDMKTALLANFEGDKTGYFSDTLRSKIEHSGILDVKEKPILDKIRTRLNLKLNDKLEVKDIVRSAKEDGVDCVLWGTLERFEEVDSGVMVKGAWGIVRVSDRKAVYVDTFKYDTITSTAAKIKQRVTELASDTSSAAGPFTCIAWQMRVLGFLVVMLLLPVCTFMFVRAMVAKRSNKVNAFMLGIYTVVDMVFAFFMVGGSFVSTAAIIVFVMSSFAAFAYNTALMSFALKLEEK